MKYSDEFKQQSVEMYEEGIWIHRMGSTGNNFTKRSDKDLYRAIMYADKKRHVTIHIAGLHAIVNPVREK